MCEVYIYISTRSTFTPQGSVASSKDVSIHWAIFSLIKIGQVLEALQKGEIKIFHLSDRISAKHLVPRTFLRVVAPNRCVEWR